MYKNKLFFIFLILFTSLHANEYFASYSDMCETNATQKCPNNLEEVKHLQITLNAIKQLKFHLDEDGRWGKETKHAVEKFQKFYAISPALGYVGRKTKIALDGIAVHAKVCKIKKTKLKINFNTFSDMCENNETQSCPNKIEEVKALQARLNADRQLKLHLTEDGKWGELTKDAVKKFQKKHHIFPALGYVGKKTKNILNHISKHKKIIQTMYQSKKTKGKNRTSYRSYSDFKKYVNLKKSFEVFQDKKLLSKANGKNTKLKIDISDQRIILFVSGKVALSSPCTTGAKHKFEPNTKIYRNQSTPLGTFKIREKIADKRSTIFGDIYRGEKKVYHGDRRKYRGKSGRYVGASLKNWMRLTSGGIGLHASKYVKRYAGSNGCIRLPYNVSKTIFKNVRKGTTVRIVH